jgi:hypothetical protein
MKLTQRSATWMNAVLANCEANTGRTLAAWSALAKRAHVKDTREARAWAKAQGLSVVYQTTVVEALFPPESGDDAMIEAQYSGPKAALRPIYDRVVRAARGLGDDVEVMPRKSQVTLSRGTSFAVVRPATKSRVDIALKLHGERPTKRLVLNPKALKSDPSHVVAVTSVEEVDDELTAWLKKAYRRAAPGARAGAT